MSDLTFIIAGAVAFGGYLFKSNKTIERDNYENIYTSNKVEDATKQVQAIADERYTDAKNPTFSGIANPVLYTTGVVGRENIESFGSVETLQQVYQDNMLIDPRLRRSPVQQNLGGNKPLKAADDSEFHTFNAVQEMSNVSRFTGDVIKLDPSVLPFTSRPMDEVRERFIPGILDSQTGNTSTFQHKQEVGSLYDGIPVTNVNSGAVFEGVTDRYIQSRFREGEKPFQPTRVQAPKAWSKDTPSEKDTFRTIDELNVNPKQSYKAKIVQGKRDSQNTRGIQAPVNLNRPSTVTSKQFLTAASANYKSTKLDEDFSTNLQSTNREAYNLDNYAGPAQVEVAQSGSWIENFTESRKTATKADYQRNVASADRKTGDYTKDSIGVYNTERESYDALPVVNVNNQKVNTLVPFNDRAKSTIREELKPNDITNITANFLKSASAAFEEGVTGIDAKTTIKEQNLFNYQGTVKGEDRMGYLASEYDAKTTLKELIADRSEYTGIYGLQNFIQNNTLQRTTVSDKKALSDKQLLRTSIVHNPVNFKTRISSKEIIGNDTSSTRDDINVIKNERLDPSLIQIQLENNPYALNKIQIPKR